jgi:hypothetical protein
MNKKTRSGKAAASTQAASEQLSVPKRKIKLVLRKIKKSPYMTEEVEGIGASTDLVTREVKRKKVEDAAALQTALEIAKEIEIHASSIARKDVGVVAQQLVEATKNLQEMASSEAGNLLRVVNAGDGVQEDITAGSEAAAPESDAQGNPDLAHTNVVVELESNTTPSSSSQSTSSSSSTD